MVEFLIFKLIMNLQVHKDITMTQLNGQCYLEGCPPAAGVASYFVEPSHEKSETEKIFEERKKKNIIDQSTNIFLE